MTEIEIETKGINFVQDFTTLSGGTEVPEYFALWTGVSGVAMMLGRNVVLDMGSYNVRPNFYILLIAGSGRLRKSTCIDWLSDCLDEMHEPPRVIAQKITSEAMIERMSEGESSENNLIPNAEAIVIADEFITFLNRRSWDAGLGDLLLPLYDCKRRFLYTTKGSGDQLLENCCCNILGGATMRGISDDMPPQLIGSGLASRFIFVYVQDHDVAVLRIKGIAKRREKIKRLARALERIRCVRGDAELTPDAWEQMEIWYQQHKKNHKFFQDPNLSGYASRWHTHVLALAIILAVSETEALSVHKKHLVLARNLIDQTEVHYPEVISQIKGTPTGQVNEEILGLVKSHRRIRYQDLVKRTKHLVSAKELGDIIHTLTASGEIQYLPSEGRHPTVRYIPEVERIPKEPDNGQLS